MCKVRLTGVSLCLLALMAPLSTVAQPSATLTSRVSTLAGTPGQSGTTDGVGAAARFELPSGLAVAPTVQRALVTEPNMHTIRQIDLTTQAVTTLAGGPEEAGSVDGVRTDARFDAPKGIAITHDGTMALIADTNNHLIRQLDVATGTVTTLAGTSGESGYVDGVGADVRFNNPGSIAMTADGDLALVADTSHSLIRQIDVATGQVTTLAGDYFNPGWKDGIGTDAHLDLPVGIALTPDGTVALVTEVLNNTIRHVVVETGQVTTLAGEPGVRGSADGIGRSTHFWSPNGVTITADGRLALIADANNTTIRAVELSTGTVTTLAGQVRQQGYRDGTGRQAQFQYPVDVVLSPDGTTAWDKPRHNMSALRHLW
ncbi:MAG: hypothetical protein HC828_04405 [Blastochloris sp.]|nr:hypothetical protein [Blastochloris sp.]